MLNLCTVVHARSSMPRMYQYQALTSCQCHSRRYCDSHSTTAGVSTRSQLHTTPTACVPTIPYLQIMNVPLWPAQHKVRMLASSVLFTDNPVAARINSGSHTVQTQICLLGATAGFVGAHLAPEPIGCSELINPQQGIAGVQSSQQHSSNAAY